MEQELRPGEAVARAAIRGLTDWVGLSHFVESFHNPLYALIGLAIVGGLIIAILLIFGMYLTACVRSRHLRDIELAKLGIVRAWWRFRR